MAGVNGLTGLTATVAPMAGAPPVSSCHAQPDAAATNDAATAARRSPLRTKCAPAPRSVTWLIWQESETDPEVAPIANGHDTRKGLPAEELSPVARSSAGARSHPSDGTQFPFQTLQVRRVQQADQGLQRRLRAVTRGSRAELPREHPVLPARSGRGQPLQPIDVPRAESAEGLSLDRDDLLG